MKPRLLVEVRKLSTEEISLDLARRLPRRLMTGQALIVADRPLVWLAVLRKRWMRIVREVEREYASTLDRWKRRILEDEIQRMRELRFGAAPAALQGKTQVDACIISPDMLPQVQQSYCSLYVTLPLTAQELHTGLKHLLPGGLLTVYGEWDERWDGVIRSLRIDG